MTHLRIEQNNIPENVSSGVITKLYELATSGDLDPYSNLAGTLHTTATYQDYITGITNIYSDLHITADNVYLRFYDTEVQRAVASVYGDGTGVTASQLALAVNSVNSLYGGSSLGGRQQKNCYYRRSSIIYTYNRNSV